jgi:outer membrane immunogenic protein
VGYGWGNGDTKVHPLPSAATFVNLLPQTLHPDPSGMIGGGQVGFNWQHGVWVAGGEMDVSGSGIGGTKIVTPITQNNGTPFPGAGNNITAHQDTSWLVTMRPRVGVTLVPRLLIYGTGGLAFGHVTYRANTDFRPVGTEQYPASFDHTRAGWVAGGGAEVGATDHWSVKAEFLHYDLGGVSFVASPVPPLPPFGISYEWETTANIVRGGVNYRF